MRSLRRPPERLVLPNADWLFRTDRRRYGGAFVACRAKALDLLPTTVTDFRGSREGDRCAHRGAVDVMFLATVRGRLGRARQHAVWVFT